MHHLNYAWTILLVAFLALPAVTATLAVLSQTSANNLVVPHTEVMLGATRSEKADGEASDIRTDADLTQGERLVAVLESMPRDIDLVGLLTMLEQQMNRRRKDLERSEDGAGEEALAATVKERAA